MPSTTLDRVEVERLRARLLKTPAKASDYPERFAGERATGKNITRLSGRQGLEDYRQALSLRLAEPIFPWPRGRAKRKYAIVRVYARPGQAPEPKRATYTKRGSRKRSGIPIALLPRLLKAYEVELKRAMRELTRSVDDEIASMKAKIKSANDTKVMLRMMTALEELHKKRDRLEADAAREALRALATTKEFGQYVRYISEYEPPRE